MKKFYSAKSFLLICLVAALFSGCRVQSPATAMKEHFPDFYKEGHRGTRGLMPENTIPAMKKAVDVGANVLEMDVQISKDGQVMVAHDPYINRNFALLPDGGEIPEEDARRYILHQMDYADIRRFDVGSKYYSSFPEQKKMPAYIPLLGELIDSVEQYTAAKGLPDVIYNIEIKANPEYDGVYQPEPQELIRLVMDVVNKKQLDNRFYIQSFDVRQIQEVHRQYPQVVIGFLTSDNKASFEDNIRKIGFAPQIYSPAYKLATSSLIEKCHEQGIKFVPWTVNTLEEMKELKAMGVDGIITDYPNLFSRL
ncbi:glycerophosphodiester phosphodiesterase family protein [Pontibacter rufus]|uniref:glycerophosphodiester phosphodiesterase family protein n=1 Tax=Pontibacter rufus TaxID=2791028 RepID=UPI001E51905F|nr:glycerophosphodiester phosphodiesterase family protein [Pontibacter sp. 172403-2]